ncbi:hypothetical protein QTG56_25865 (plasmid) [Rossellomorea sp. AcN35-11]|nr:hypothetical protein [Rossellomorea aquimaris]WJV32044.1 hypothetical protein QTG56_25865 [Rossellomorea sp. AcN35-11]
MHIHKTFEEIVNELGGEKIVLKPVDGTHINPLKLNHFKKKTVLLKMLEQDENIIIIDPENEYETFEKITGVKRVSSLEEINDTDALIIKG